MKKRIAVLNELLKAFKAIQNKIDNILDLDISVLSDEDFDRWENINAEISKKYTNRIHDEINFISGCKEIKNEWALNVLSGLNFKQYEDNTFNNVSNVFITNKQYECITRNMTQSISDGRNFKYSCVSYSGYDKNYMYHAYDIKGKSGYNTIVRTSFIDIDYLNNVINDLNAEILDFNSNISNN